MSSTIAMKNLTTTLTVHREFVVLDMRSYFNNDGISFDDLKCDGDFDGKGGTFPAEELPPSNALISVDGIPFFFPSKENGDVNNMVLSGQSIGFDETAVTAIHILGAVEGQNGEVYEEEVTISLEDGTYHPAYLKLSNWLLPAQYDERAAFLCSHLHFPDTGQQSLLNRHSAEIENYRFAEELRYRSSASDAAVDRENAAKGIWRPRLWIQTLPLDFKKPVIGITFMDNLNFHLFAVTLEKRIRQ